jgi:hypothetical protein
MDKSAMCANIENHTTPKRLGKIAVCADGNGQANHDGYQRTGKTRMENCKNF